VTGHTHGAGMLLAMGAPAAGDRDPAEAARAAAVAAALLAALERIATSDPLPPVPGATPGELRAALDAARRRDREAGT
jgi:hypothetical protein